MLTYTYRYNRTIQWFKAHKPATDILCETHHIIPRSMGGDNSPDNMVDLPIRWHYIVHCWLPAMYAEQGNQEGYEKMLFAWNRMQNYRRGHRNALKCVKEDSELYRKLREEFIKLTSQRGQQKACENNPHFKHHWWKDPNDKTKSMSIKEGDPVPEGWVRGRWISEETKEKAFLSNSNRGKVCLVNVETGGRKYVCEEESEKAEYPWLNTKQRNSLKQKSKTRKTPADKYSNKEWQQHLEEQRQLKIKHHEEKMKLLRQKKEKRHNDNVVYWTKVAEDYNAYGIAYVMKKYKRGSKTNCFSNMRKYSSIPINTKDMAGRTMTRGKLDTFTATIRKMSKEERLALYREMYATYLSQGFDKMAEKYGYSKCRNTALHLFKQVPEYVPQDCARWKH